MIQNKCTLLPKQVSEVERERLTEHLRMISKKLRLADEAMRESELALREERRRTAHLVINSTCSKTLTLLTLLSIGILIDLSNIPD